MEDLELLNIVEYGFNNYIDDKLNNKFGLMEYYSLTDLEPNQLSRVARRNKKASLATTLLKFSEDFYWLRQPVKMDEKLKLLHAVAGHELTQDEKLTIHDKLKEEGFPLIEGIFNYAARLFVTQGIDSISKEQIREKIVKFYNDAHGVKSNKSTSNKTLVK